MVGELIDGVTRQAPKSRGQNMHPTVEHDEGRYEQYAPVIPEPIPSWSPVKYYPGYYHK